MASHGVTIRDAVYDKLVVNKGSFVIPAEVEKTDYPQHNLQEMEDETFVLVVGLSYGTVIERGVRAVKRILLNLPVQIAIQRRVDPRDLSTTNQLKQLYEQVFDLCMDDKLVADQDYTFQRIEPLADENGLVFNHEQLTQNGVWQGIFTTHYQFVKNA